MPNLTKEKLNELCKQSYSAGYDNGYRVGLEEAKKTTSCERTKAITDLYKSVGLTLDAVAHHVMSIEKYS